MCDPVTIGTVTITASQMLMAGMAAAAGGVAAYGAKQSSNYHSKIAQNNAVIAKQKGDDELRLGAAEDQQQRWKIRALLGKQSAAFGANNTVGSTGTALDILGETSLFGEVDLTTIRNNAARRAWGYDVESSNSLAEGKLAKYGGKMSMASTLLGTGAQVVGMFSPSFGAKPSALSATSPSTPDYSASIKGPRM